MSVKGTSLNATAENLQTHGLEKVKTKKKPSPRVKGPSLKTIEETGTELSLNTEETQPKTRKKKKPPSRVKGLSLNTPENLQIVKRTRTKKKPPPRVKGLSLNTPEDSYKPNISIKNASKKVGSFMIKHRSKIRLTFLNTICSDSNVCISFGKEIKVIREFFNDFSFDLLSERPRLISTSNNGAVQLLTFKRDKYVANAIFKTSNENDADNLAYEAIVGKFINKQKLRFPCFLETYGLFHNSYYQKNIRNYVKINIDKEALLHSCEEPLSMGLMIENIKESKTLGNTLLNLSSPKYNNFMNFEMLYILYQIYAPLSILSKIFTHYDLHYNNIMLYEPVKSKHIEYHYHYPDHEVVFNSGYIVKIIDYGRCFFEDEYNPRDIYKDLCDSKKDRFCYDCGFPSGYGWLGPIPQDYISSQRRNMSHDLRLLHILKFFNPTYNRNLLELIENTVYITKFGTPENTSKNDKICNVNDARRLLEGLIAMDDFKKNNDYDPGLKLGEMHIYSDGRPMVYKAV